MNDVRELTEELAGVLGGLKQTEVSLAELHASIYQCREEARKIRRSAPTQEYLDGVKRRVSAGMTDLEAQRCAGVLRDKLRKARSAAKKMRETLTCRFQRKQPAPHRHVALWVFSVLVLMVGGGVCYYYYYYHRQRQDK